MQNPLLKKYFTQSEFLFEKPLTISQISFDKKSTYLYDILLLGDSAGAIAPLCGNGMSIAMRSSKFLATHISLFLKHTISKQELIENYTKEWNANFSLRIKTAYYLQQLFGKEFTTLMSLKLLNTFPSFFRKIISLTHGKPF
jgi:flavin-dependent dehydrogenase